MDRHALLIATSAPGSYGGLGAGAVAARDWVVVPADMAAFGVLMSGGETMATENSVQCQCGKWSGEPCAWHGPETETVIVQFMPEQHRASHKAAGNAGIYPHNGASRIRVHRDCADYMLEHDPEWTEIL